MSGLERFILGNRKKIGLSLLICAGLAGISCLERPDYNFLIFIFVYYSSFTGSNKIPIKENYESIEKKFTTTLIFYSIIIDILWIFQFNSRGFALSILIGWIEILAKLFYGCAEFILVKNIKNTGPLEGRMNEEDKENDIYA